MTLGEKIKAARKSAGMKQSELAQALKKLIPGLRVGNTTISSWEVNNSKPDIDTLKAIKQIFDLSPDYFFDGEQREKPTTPEGGGLEPEIAELVKLYCDASPEMKAAARGMLEAAEKARVAQETAAKDK